MVYPIQDKLVIAVASSALFDLSEPHAVFLERGTEAYRRHQREHENDPLPPGVAFPFVQRILGLNGTDETEAERPVEVVLISRNDPDTGSRVFRSIEHHGLSITRAAFLGGKEPWPYIAAFNAALFLSGDQANVEEAIRHGCPAGRVLGVGTEGADEGRVLRIAFDFDGVLADDEAQTVFQREGVEGFNESEARMASRALNPGPLKPLLEKIAGLQRRKDPRAGSVAGGHTLIRTAIVTSRDGPARQRVVTTLRAWGIQVDETFFLGGMDKGRVLQVFRPHIFFDDHIDHAGPAAGAVPSVHVPFGVVNR